MFFTTFSKIFRYHVVVSLTFNSFAVSQSIAFANVSDSELIFTRSMVREFVSTRKPFIFSFQDCSWALNSHVDVFHNSVKCLYFSDTIETGQSSVMQIISKGLFMTSFANTMLRINSTEIQMQEPFHFCSS